MWGSGDSDTWPPRYAVGSPPRSAARAWAASCTVVENRNAANHRRPRTSVSLSMLIQYGIGVPALRISWAAKVAPQPSAALESARPEKREELHVLAPPIALDGLRRAPGCPGRACDPRGQCLGAAREVPRGSRAHRAGEGRKAPAGGQAPARRSPGGAGRRADGAVRRRLAARVPGPGRREQLRARRLRRALPVLTRRREDRAEDRRRVGILEGLPDLDDQTSPGRPVVGRRAVHRR